jgi:hypothetical protein
MKELAAIHGEQCRHHRRFAEGFKD